MDLRVFFYRKFVVGQGRERSIAREFLKKNEKKVRKKHLLCYIENVGANIVRPPTWCSKAFPGIRVFSTSYALPMAVASSSGAMIFKIILNPTIGIVNKLLHVSINWVSDPKYALICVAVLTAWLNSGINFLYFSAGLGNIDDSIYERASVDGANAVQKFFKLTLPGLSPIMFYTLVVNIIQAFQSFGQVKILTQGGPGESTNLIVYSIYRDAFFNYRFGSAAAQSVVLFLIVMALTLVMFRMEKRGVKY